MGAFRAFLATLVVIEHLAGGFGSDAGTVAVFSFYVLSGYLITTIVCTTYANGFRGLCAFAVNRFLRLYPTYWFVALVSLAIVIALPREAQLLNPVLTLPGSRIDALAQVTIVGLHKIFYLNPSRLVPTAWSLNVELVYYCLIATVLGRWRSIATLWWGASLALALRSAWSDDFHSAYFTLWGPSICFSTGAVTFHYAHLIKVAGAGVSLRMVAFLVLGVIAFAPELGATISQVTLIYAAIPATVFAIAVLDTRWPFPRFRRLDVWFADISYPLFLSHWPVAVAVGALLAGSALSPTLLLVSLPAAFVFSALVTRFVEGPIRALRNVVRRSAVSRVGEVATSKIAFETGSSTPQPNFE